MVTSFLSLNIFVKIILLNETSTSDSFIVTFSNLFLSIGKNYPWNQVDPLDFWLAYRHISRFTFSDRWKLSVDQTDQLLKLIRYIFKYYIKKRMIN